MPPAVASDDPCRRVLVDHPADGVTRLRLNRPAARNALDRAMVDALVAAIGAFAADDEQRVMIVTGRGPAFCAGGDLGEMADIVARPAGAQRDYLWRHLQRIPRAFATLDKPVVMAVNGPAHGAGLDIALMGDLRIAARSARFASSYVNLGLAAGDGGAWFMTRLIGIEKTLELLWTGRTVDAVEASQLGLVGSLVDDSELDHAALSLASRLADQPPAPLRMMKRAVCQAARTGLDTHLDLLASHMAVLYDSPEFQSRLAALTDIRAGGRSLRDNALPAHRPHQPEETVMQPAARGLQYLLDRREIEDVLARYFRGLDRGEPETVRSCFTDDVIARYDGRSAFRSGNERPVTGVDALLDGLITFKRQAAGDWKVSTHFIGQINLVSLTDDEALTETYAIACIVQRRAPEDAVAQRALRYLDRLRRTPAGWRIAERTHTLDWATETPPVFTTNLAERLKGP